MRPWLLLPSKLAHDISPYLLNAYSRFKSLDHYTWEPFEWKGLQFSNRLGIAGGVDKNGENVEAWWTLGAGFVEVGTVTPQPQEPNPGKIMDRHVSAEALWNKMGFPSKGCQVARSHLKALYQPHFSPVFVNVGKNRNTPNEEAAKDYIYLIDHLHEYADAFVINVSSPNTKGLRDLLKPAQFKAFLSPVIEANQAKSPVRPILLKISPDMEQSDLLSIIDTSYELGIDGWILTNTTSGPRNGLPFPDEGGVSGRPLSRLSKQVLKWTIEHLGDRREGKLIVSCGGAMSSEDVFFLLQLGADLVQAYTALVYRGPFFFRQVAKAAESTRIFR